MCARVTLIFVRFYDAVDGLCLENILQGTANKFQLESLYRRLY